MYTMTKYIRLPILIQTVNVLAVSFSFSRSMIRIENIVKCYMSTYEVTLEMRPVTESSHEIALMRSSDHPQNCNEYWSCLQQRMDVSCRGRPTYRGLWWMRKQSLSAHRWTMHSSHISAVVALQTRHVPEVLFRRSTVVWPCNSFFTGRNSALQTKFNVFNTSRFYRDSPSFEPSVSIFWSTFSGRQFVQISKFASRFGFWVLTECILPTTLYWCEVV